MKISPKTALGVRARDRFLVAHLAFLPSTLEDIDSLNFALGIHDFDPSKHQPHPPGYPIFIALGKTVARRLACPTPARCFLGRALRCARRLSAHEDLQELEMLDGRRTSPSAICRVALATVARRRQPLFWFTALRPMSDVPGLAMTLAAQAALVLAFVRASSRNAAAGSARRVGQIDRARRALAALAIGMRSQAIWLTRPTARGRAAAARGARRGGRAARQRHDVHDRRADLGGPADDRERRPSAISRSDRRTGQSSSPASICS